LNMLVSDEDMFARDGRVGVDKYRWVFVDKGYMGIAYLEGVSHGTSNDQASLAIYKDD
jgi:hypothetical protein